MVRHLYTPGLVVRGLPRKGLMDLRQLDLGNTKVSAAGIADLRKALPKVKVLQ